MAISLEPLKQHLIKDRKSGAPMAILFAQFALLSTSVFLYKTAIITNQNGGGIITVLSYQIVALLLPYSRYLSKLKLLRWGCGGYKVNTAASTALLVIGIIVGIHYEKSFAQFAVLGVVLSLTVLVLVLLIIIRPRSDLGFLGFLIGLAATIAGKHYKAGYITCIVIICAMISFFNYWLKKNWLEPEEAGLQLDQRPLLEPNTSSSSNIQGNEMISSFKLSRITEAIIVPVFYLGGDLYLLIISSSCPPLSDLISCIPSALKKSVPFVLGLCFSIVIVLRFYTNCIRQNRVREIPDEELADVRTSDENRPQPVGITAETTQQRHRLSQVMESAQDFISSIDSTGQAESDMNPDLQLEFEQPSVSGGSRLVIGPQAGTSRRKYYVPLGTQSKDECVVM